MIMFPYKLIKTRTLLLRVLLNYCEFLRAKAANAFSASQPSQFCLSVRPSVTRVDQLKTVHYKITKSLPSAA